MLLISNATCLEAKRSILRPLHRSWAHWIQGAIAISLSVWNFAWRDAVGHVYFWVARLYTTSRFVGEWLPQDESLSMKQTLHLHTEIMWHPAIATPSALQHITQRCGRNLKWKNRGQASMKKMKGVKENFGGNKQNPKKNHLRPGPTNGSREETEHPSKWLWRAKIWPMKNGRNSSLLFYISCVDRLIKVVVSSQHKR